MICIADKSRISVFNYLYLFCIIIYAGGATIFARSMSTPFTIGNAFALLLTFALIQVNNIKFNKNFGTVIAVFSLYALFTFIQNGRISSMWLIIWLINFLITYVVIANYGSKLFVIYETIIYHLCLFALFFWILYLVVPGFVEGIVSVFQFSSSYSSDIQSKNMIVYTIMDKERLLLNEFVSFPRNAGFAWEPGAFACFICLAIFCNIIRTNLKLKNNSYLFVLIATLLTTSSTTGYFILIVVFIMWIISTRKFLHMIYMIPIGTVLFFQPFVRDKFMEEYNNIEYVDVASYDSDINVALGRMSSLQLDWEEFLRHPILGLGGYSEGTWLMQQGYDNIATISGVGKLLSRYGIILTITFILLLIKSARYINLHYQTRTGWLMIVVIIGMMISYNLWTHPVFMMFWMYGLWHKPTK